MTRPSATSTPDRGPEPFYDPTSARDLVNHQLRELGLGERYVPGDRGFVERVLPVDRGWCRAGTLTQAAWPDGVDLCVLVDWFPDAALRRDSITGCVPSGAEQHWCERVAATADALESLGYVVERNGPPRSARTHSYAQLLVYRMSPGVAPVRLPADAWAGAEANPPHFGRRGWYPDPNPVRDIEDVLADCGLLIRTWQPPDPEHSALHGSTSVRDITQTVWPPDASACALVRWQPAEQFQPANDSPILPPGARRHWSEATSNIRDTLQSAGYTVRYRARPWDPQTEDHVDALVHRSSNRQHPAPVTGPVVVAGTTEGAPRVQNPSAPRPRPQDLM